MARSRISTKQLAIDKDKARIGLVVVASSAIIVFSLVASRNLVGKMLHQNKVIDAKTSALDQLEANSDELKDLRLSYEVFDGASQSVLGKTGEKNSKIVLDALPSKYDYPGLLSSIEGFANNGGYFISNISGTDGSIEAVQTSPDPTPVEIPLTIAIDGNYTTAQRFLSDLDLSIRPFKVQTLTLSGSGEEMSLEVGLVTYYQPERVFELGTEEIK